MSGLRSASYGGGRQSTALLILAAQGRIDADVGRPPQAAPRAFRGPWQEPTP